MIDLILFNVVTFILILSIAWVTGFLVELIYPIGMTLVTLQFLAGFFSLIYIIVMILKGEPTGVEFFDLFMYVGCFFGGHFYFDIYKKGKFTARYLI